MQPTVLCFLPYNGALEQAVLPSAPESLQDVAECRLSSVQFPLKSSQLGSNVIHDLRKRGLLLGMADNVDHTTARRWSAGLVHKHRVEPKDQSPNDAGPAAMSLGECQVVVAVVFWATTNTMFGGSCFETIWTHQDRISPSANQRI